MGVKTNMSSSVKCQHCGYTIDDDYDIDKETGKHKPCPKCGCLARITDETGKEQIIKAQNGYNGILDRKMTSESWTIFGLFLGLIIPPVFYVVFTLIDINIGYKLLIWLGIILSIFLLTRCFSFIDFLRWIAEKSYGKHKI
jgi:predicted nucleic-acid-binding Zn-ribbon protein